MRFPSSYLMLLVGIVAWESPLLVRVAKPI